MFKRPSSRRKSENHGIELNLVPMLDALVTLIAFLMFTMSFLNVVSIESPFPQASAEDVQKKLKEKPLQLTVSLREKEMEVWSPFDRIPAKVFPNGEDGKPDTIGLHEALVKIKQQFPHETKIVIVPHPQLSYDILISLMDAVRTLEATDPPIFVRNESTGTDVPAKLMFPEVVFGNLLGDT